MDAPQEKEKVESNNNKNKIYEKVKNKLKDYSELRCLYNLSNGGVRFKRNISLIVRERIEKNINKNPGKNNYYSEQNPSCDVFNLKNLIQSIFDDYVKRNNIDVKTELTKMEAELEEKREQMGKNKVFISNMPKKNKNNKNNNNTSKKKEQPKVNESGRRNRNNYAMYVINDKKKKNKFNENNDIFKTEVLDGGNGTIKNNNCKRKSLLLEKKESEKEENENKKKQEENKNNIDNNYNILEYEKNERNKEIKNNNAERKTKREREKYNIIIRTNSRKQKFINLDLSNKDDANESIKDIIKKTVNKRKMKEKIKDNIAKLNNTLNSPSRSYLGMINPRKRYKENKKLNYSYNSPTITKLEYNNNNNDENYIATDNRDYIRPKYLWTKELIRTSPRKKSKEGEKKIRKASSFKKKDSLNKVKVKKKVSFKDTKTRSKSNKKSEKKDLTIINIPKTIQKSSSLRRLMISKKKKHHRHHHFQHFKKPQRIVTISNLDSFCIMNFNS